MFAQTGRFLEFSQNPRKKNPPRPCKSQFQKKKIAMKRGWSSVQPRFFWGASFETTPLKRPNLSGDKFFEPPGSQREWLQQVMFGVFPEVSWGRVGKMWSVMGWDCWGCWGYQLVWANYNDLSKGNPFQNPLNSGLGIILICPDVFLDDWGDGFHFFGHLGVWGNSLQFDVLSSLVMRSQGEAWVPNQL